MTPIFIQSWNRYPFTMRVIEGIRRHTQAGTYSIHVLDNGSDEEVQANLCTLYLSGIIDGLTLLLKNTACVHPKHVFSALTPDSIPYACITDNDFIPAQDWLPKMLAIMERNPNLAAASPQYWPQWPMEPADVKADFVSCRAIGNTFKVIRTSAMRFAMPHLPNNYGLFGDDGDLCRILKDAGYEVGFARDVFTYNLELTEDNWGYTETQLKEDPRKAGYTKPITYTPVDWETLAPPAELRIG